MQSFLRRISFNLKYFRKPPWDTGISPPELLEFINTVPVGRALDLGCGTGTNLLTLARAGWQVTGVDFALKAARAAKRRLAEAGLTGEVLTGDVTRLGKLNGGFSLVLDIGCYHGIALIDRARYRENLSRLLAPGGCFLLYAHMAAQNQPSGIGINESEIDAFSGLLLLRKREDSLDRWERRAVWLTFERREENDQG